MLVAQAGIPVALLLCAVFAGGLALVVSGSAALPGEQRRIGRAIAAVADFHRLRLALVSALLVLATGAAVAAVAGYYRESLETGLFAGGSVAAGATVVLLAVLFADWLSGAAAARDAAGLDPRGHGRRAASVGAGGFAAIVTLAACVAVFAGLYALYTAVAGERVEDAPVLLGGFAFGAAAAAAALAAGAAIYAGASATGEVAGTRHRPTFDAQSPAVIAGLAGMKLTASSSVAGFAAALAAALVAGTAAGATIYELVRDIEWVLLPVALAAGGVLAAGLGLVVAAFVARPGGGRPFLVGVLVALVAAVAVAIGLPLLMLDEGAWPMAAAGTAGSVAGVVGLAWPAKTRDAGARRAYLLAVAGLCVVVAGACGAETSVDGLRGGIAGVYGVTLAAVAASSVMTVGAAIAATAANLHAAAAIAAMVRRDEPLSPTAVADAADRAGRLADRGHAALALGVVLASVALAGALLLQARADLARVAIDDHVRFARLAEELGLVPPGPAPRAQLADDIRRHTASVEAAGLDEDAQASLFPLTPEELRISVAARLADEVIDPGAAGVTASPLPLPALLPVSTGNVALAGGVAAGAALTLLVRALVARAIAGGARAVAAEVERQWRAQPGILVGRANPDRLLAEKHASRAALDGMLLPAMAVLTLPVALAVAARYAGGGNEGWLAAIGIIGGAIVAFIAAGSRGGPGDGDAWAGAALPTLALAAVAGLFLVSPALLLR